MCSELPSNIKSIGAGEAELPGRVQLQSREPAGRNILEEAHTRKTDGNCSQGNKMDNRHSQLFHDYGPHSPPKIHTIFGVKFTYVIFFINF